MPELVEFFEKKFKSENHHFLSSKGIEKKIKSNLVTYIKNNLGFGLTFYQLLTNHKKSFCMDYMIRK